MSEAYHTLSDLDRLIHEPSRLLLVALLSSVESADFLFLLKESRLTRGNLTVHLSRLEEAGYIQVEKTIRGKYPHTEYQLTPQGSAAFDRYRNNLGRIFDKKRGRGEGANS
jgi:DNA-binding PadR family transcriptional regulator